VSRVEIVDTEAGVLALRAAWEALAARGGASTPFQSWSLTYRSLRMDRGAVEPFVLVVRDDDGEVAGLWPLGLVRLQRGPFTWRSLETIGPKRLDFVDLIATRAAAPSVLAACTQWLAEHWSAWDDLLLAPTRADAVLLEALARIELPAALAHDIEPISDNLALSIPEGAHSYEDVIGGETRRTTRRIVKRLAEAGFAARSVASGHPLGAAVEAFVRLHAQRRGEFGQVSRYRDVDRSELCALVTDAVADGGDLAVLERGGAAVAAQLTLRCGAQISHYRLAFDSEHKSLSPGIGLLAAGVDDAIRAGVREYDFGFGAEEYKRRWSNVRRAVYRVSIKNHHVARAPRRAWFFAAHALRRLRHRARRVRSPRRAQATPA
jgi:CelD/BcsL family acetyltransferase involved in cellulose biosynthesis